MLYCYKNVKYGKIIDKYDGWTVGIEHIDTPRTENTLDCYYNAKTDKLNGLGFKPTRTIEDEIRYIFSILKNIDLSELLKVVMPKIKW